MTFGDKFRAIRTHRAMDTTLEDGTVVKATRQQIRDRIRAFQLRNDGTWKDTRPKVDA